MNNKFKDIIINNIFTQYIYTNIAKLCLNKGEAYNVFIGDVVQNFNHDILNLNTCSFENLKNFWGKIFGLTDVIAQFVLSVDDLKKLIRIRCFFMCWNGCLYSLLFFLRKIYGNNMVYIRDRENMAVISIFFLQKISALEKWIFNNKNNIIFTPAAVGDFKEIDTDHTFFGFGEYFWSDLTIITSGFETYNEENIWPIDATCLTYLDD